MLDRIRILNQKQIAAACGVSVSTVRRWRLDGRFPKRKSFAGATRGWLFDDILDWLKNCPEEDSEKTKKTA